jgi:hypothetical protein
MGLLEFFAQTIPKYGSNIVETMPRFRENLGFKQFSSFGQKSQGW